MTYTLPFTDLGKHDAGSAGGKGASLGEMTQAGIPVPPGFVVLAGAFEYFLQETDLVQEIDAILKTVDTHTIHTVEKASADIQALILRAQMPATISREILEGFRGLDTPYVAVRSSATAEDGAEHAWAGQLDSFLNTTEGALLQNVQKCWASLFTPRAIFYRFEKGLNSTHISVAVVVQAMINSEVSGIAFSVHPVTEDRDQMIIEAGFGLGEAIVSGQVTPDSYVVSKGRNACIDINVNNQSRALYRNEGGRNTWKDLGEEGKEQVLTEAQILELATLVKKIEDHYGFPCDIEWCFENGIFYIVQSRPITTLSSNKADLPSLKLEDFNSRTASIEHADGLPIYFEMTMAGFTDTLYDSSIASYNVGISHFKQGEVDYISLVDDQYVIGKSIVETYIKNPSQIRSLYTTWKTQYDTIESYAIELLEKDLSALSTEELLTLSNDLYRFFRHDVSMPGFSDGFMFYAEKRLAELLRVFCNENNLHEYTHLFAVLTASIEPSFFNEKESALWNAHTHEKEKVLKKYAWIRSSYAGYVPYTHADITKEKKELKDPDIATEQLLSNTREKETLIQTHGFTPEIIAIVRLTELFTKWQDQRKEYTLWYVTLRSKLVHAIALSIGYEAELLAYALTEELNDVISGSLSKDALRERKDKGVLFVHAKGTLQKVIAGDEAEAFMKTLVPQQTAEVQLIHGTTASRGKVSGPVKIVTSVKHLEKVENGDVLVAPMTRPEHLPGMKKASAIITDDGGITCHAAIVSRELGKPCIIGTKIATQVLKDGDLVEVDADNGVVRVVSRAD